MLSLPEAIIVQLRPKHRDILVTFDVAIEMRYYTRCWVGLTDDDGLAGTTREGIERDFKENQEFFIMDYKVPLVDCDPTVIFRIDGGPAFAARRAEVQAESWVRSDARAVWARARNDTLRSMTFDVDLSKADPHGELRITLPVSLA